MNRVTWSVLRYLRSTDRTLVDAESIASSPERKVLHGLPRSTRLGIMLREEIGNSVNGTGERPPVPIGATLDFIGELLRCASCSVDWQRVMDEITEGR